jgi:SAM-dependent methyltransferase
LPSHDVDAAEGGVPRLPNPHDHAGETFDRIAKAFDSKRSRPWPFVADWTASLGATDDPVVDVGCGNGRHLALVVEKGMRGIGFDLSRELLSIARSRLPLDAGMVLGDARSLPVQDAFAGAILAVAVLHHIPTTEGRRAAAQELARVARPGARALVSA